MLARYQPNKTFLKEKDCCILSKLHTIHYQSHENISSVQQLQDKNYPIPIVDGFF